MMNLKKIGVLGIAACALFATGCNREPAETAIYYDDAKAWVKENYGTGEGTDTLPASASSDWAFGGYITRWAGDFSNTMMYLRNHMTSFLNQFCFINENPTTKITSTFHCGQDIVEKGVTTTEAEEGYSFDEYAFKTTETLVQTSFSKGSFYKGLTYDNFDNVLDYFFSGFNKKACDYIVKGKSLTVKGTFAYCKESESAKGCYDILKIPSCAVTFDEKGILNNVTFNFANDESITYDWYNGTTLRYSSSFTFVALKNSYITLNFKY